MKLSVIVPVLNEAARIEQTVRRLDHQAGIHECIVIDGGSGDNTVAVARACGARVLDGPRGRGHQLNFGADQATGDVLLFLHADVRLPDNVADIVARTLSGTATVAGAFRTWTVHDGDAPPWWAPLLHLADVRSRYSSLPYGDQAMFVRADTFHAAGGFPDEPLMEDLALSRRLRTFGAIRIAKQSVRVSGRRFESAPLRQTLWVNLFPALYALGVPTRMLARLYGNPR